MKEKESYVVSITDDRGDTSKLFDDLESAKKFFNEQKEREIKIVVLDNGLDKAEEKEYRDELKLLSVDDGTYLLCVDPDGNWSIELFSVTK